MRGNLYRKMVLESKGIDVDTIGDDIFQETARGRINRGMKKKYRAIGYDRRTQSIIVEDPETGEKYPINIMHDMGTDVALTQVDAINAYLDAIKLNPNDNRIKAKSKLILSKVLQKALPAVELPQQMSNKYGAAELNSNIIIPKELMQRLSREEFKAIVDHEIQHSHQERMFKRGSGEAVDNYGYGTKGSDVKRAMTIAAQKKFLPGLFGPNKSIANNATTEWIKNYVNSPAGDKLEKSHDKYLFELEADAMAVRKNGAKVYTQALMHLYGMQAKTIKDMTIEAAENSAAQKLDKNIKALGNLRQYMHMHNGEIDDATLTKLVNFSESPVDKATSGLTQIITQIREIRSYARANNIPLNFGSIKEIMNTLNSFEKISLSFSNPYTTLNPARKEKLLKMDPSKRIAYIDKVYENCLNARKENVNIDKVVAKLDKQLEDLKKGFEARCQFCIAIEKAAPWAKEATTEFAVIFSDALNIVFGESYTIEDFVVDLLYDEEFMYVINSYDDPMVDYITECATFIDYDGIDFFEEAEELLSEKFDPEEDYDEEESEEITEDETEEEYEDDGKMTVDDIDDSEFEEPVDDNFGGTNPYPVDSNRTVDVDITMTNFGADNSPQQNQYDPKEIERLNALLASENSAIGEYFQASKETNVDVLRRLYSDIGEEERFHSEQLLFAKSQITGERYVPRDPDVKREYEELLSMGMDEETAMTTAVDKVGLMSKGQEISPEESIQQMEFVVDQLEMVQKSIYQEYLLFELTTSSMINSTRKRDEAFAVYTEAYINDVFSSPEVFLEEVANSTEKDKSDVKILSISIKGFLKLIGNIIGAIKRVAHSIAIWATNMRQHRKAKIKWLKNHKLSDLFRHGLHLYFYDDEKAQFTYDAATKYLNRLRLTTSMIANKVGVQFQEKNPQTASVADNFNPSTIDDAVNNIRNVSLSKTKVILNDKNTTMFLDQAFGVGQDLNNASNNSVYNKFDVLLKDFNSACESTKSFLEKIEQMEGDKNSLRYKDVDLYKKMVDSLKYVLKSYQMFINALTSDLQTLANADKEFTRVATQESGENTENETTGNPEQQTPTTSNNTPTASTASASTKPTTSIASTASAPTNPKESPTASGTPATPAASGNPGNPGNSGEPAPSEQKEPGFFERRKETRRQKNEMKEQQSADKKKAEVINARKKMSDIDEKLAEYNWSINKDIINTVRDKLTLLMKYYNELNQIVVYEYDQDILADDDEIYVELSMPFGKRKTNAYVDNLKRDYMNDIMSSARNTFKAYFDTIKKFVDSGQNIDVKPVIENSKWMLKNCKPIMTDDIVVTINNIIKYLSNKK